MYLARYLGLLLAVVSMTMGCNSAALGQPIPGSGYVTAESGAPGGNAGPRYMCPTGAFLEEVQVQVGQWMAQATLKCVAIDKTGHWIGQPSDGPTVGGNGGNSTLHYGCGADELIAAYAATLVHVSGGGDYVAYVAVTCLDPQTGAIPRHSGGPLSQGVEGNLQYSTVGDETLGGDYGCPVGWAANGLALRTGHNSDIDRFGLVCAPLSISNFRPPVITTLVTPQTPPSVTQTTPAEPAYTLVRSVMCPSGMAAISFENRWTNVHPVSGYQSQHDDNYQIRCSKLDNQLKPVGASVLITDPNFSMGQTPASAICKTGQFVTTRPWVRDTTGTGWSPLDVDCLDPSTGQRANLDTGFLFSGLTISPRLWSQSYLPGDAAKCQFPDAITGVEIRDYGSGATWSMLTCNYVQPPTPSAGLVVSPPSICQQHSQICTSAIHCREVISSTEGVVPGGQLHAEMVCSSSADSAAAGKSLVVPHSEDICKKDPALCRPLNCELHGSPSDGPRTSGTPAACLPQGRVIAAEPLR